MSGNLRELCELSIRAYLQLLDMQIEDSERKRKKSCWVRPILRLRKDLGHEETLVREMSNRDPEWYFMYFRMDCDQFEWILKRLRPVLERKYVVREPLSAKLRLMVTLR